MAYRLKDGESVRDGVRRCSCEELDRAAQELTDGITADPVVAIHDARKALKKERSLLRLTRAAFPRDERRYEAGMLREAARSLSGTRDADVMIEGLDDLSERCAGTVPERTFAAARTLLVARRDEEREEATNSGWAGAVAIELRAARRRVENWNLGHGGWRAIAEGLERSYRRGRHAFKLARAEPTAENLHDWRKRVKDLWYHLRLLRRLSEPTMKGQADEAHRLSELLGDDHDLWVLREALTGATRSEIAADIAPLVAVIDHRRGELQTDAILLGARVYAERPKAFVRRIRHYWRAWRAESTRTSAGATERPTGEPSVSAG